MAGIPLFDPSYLSSPTMFGSVSPKTADILAAAGKQVADTIEKQSTQFEAEQKAPQIADLMGKGLTLLASGDTTGFNYLAQAHATGATNPFLAKMTQDALAEGNRTFNAHISESNADKRFKQSIDLQNVRDNRAALSDAEREKRANEAALAESDRQLINKHQTEMEKFQQDEAARKAIADRNGEQFTPGTPPTAPTPRSQAFGGRGAPDVPVAARGVSPKKLGAAPTPMDGSPLFDVNDTFVPGTGPVPTAQANPPTQTPVSQTTQPPQVSQTPLVNENPPPAPVAAPAPKPSAAPAPKVESRTVGNLIIEVAHQNDRPEESVKTATGTVKFDKQKAPATELVENLDKIQSIDPSFSTWATDQLLAGNQVGIRSTGKTQGVEAFQPVAVRKDKTEVPYGKIDPTTQQPTGATQTIGKDTADAFHKAQALMSGPLKGQVQFYRNVDDRGKAAATNTALQGVADKQYSLDVANKHLAFIKAPPITQKQVEDEIARRQDEKKAGASVNTDQAPPESNISANPITQNMGATAGMSLTPEDYRAMSR